LGWDAVDAAAPARLGSQGGFRTVSERRARGRTALNPAFAHASTGVHCPAKPLAKTVRGRQNRVVLAPVAGVKSAEILVGPTGFSKIANSPMTVARRIRRRGERGISR